MVLLIHGHTTFSYLYLLLGGWICNPPVRLNNSVSKHFALRLCGYTLVLFVKCIFHKVECLTSKYGSDMEAIPLTVSTITLGSGSPTNQLETWTGQYEPGLHCHMAHTMNWSPGYWKDSFYLWFVHLFGHTVDTIFWAAKRIWVPLRAQKMHKNTWHVQNLLCTCDIGKHSQECMQAESATWNTTQSSQCTYMYLLWCHRMRCQGSASKHNIMIASFNIYT